MIWIIVWEGFITKKLWEGIIYWMGKYHILVRKESYIGWESIIYWMGKNHILAWKESYTGLYRFIYWWKSFIYWLGKNHIMWGKYHIIVWERNNNKTRWRLKFYKLEQIISPCWSPAFSKFHSYYILKSLPNPNNLKY